MIFTQQQIDRFKTKIKKTDYCWDYLGGIGKSGYGVFALTHRKFISSHRMSYQIFKGEIPEGLTIDHLCKNKKCINPNHLEAVTSKENTTRALKKEFCLNGHNLEQNSRYFKNGNRACKICHREKQRVWQREKFGFKPKEILITI